MMAGESKDHVEEFKDCIGIVEGPSYPNGEGPEVDVRWIPSNLKYGYHPDNLEKSSKEDYLRKSIEESGFVYFVDASKKNYPIIRIKVSEIVNVKKGNKIGICKVEIPSKYSSYFQHTQDTTLVWNDNSKHLYLEELTHRSVNIEDRQFGWNYSNAVSLRKKIIQRIIDGLYNQVKELIITQNQNPDYEI